MNNPVLTPKTMIERFIDMYNNDRGTRVNIVDSRMHMALGKEQFLSWGDSQSKKNYIIWSKSLLRKLRHRSLRRWFQVSDMCWVGDVVPPVVATEKACEGTIFLEAVEVGPKETKQSQQIAELIIQLSGSNSKIVNHHETGEIPEQQLVQM